MARYYFPHGDAIGKYVRIDRDPRTGGWYGNDQPYQVIGVVGNAKYTELRAAPPRTMYFNMFQENRIQSQFVLHTGVDPDSIAGPARQMVRDVLKTARVSRVTTLSRQIDAAIVPERLVATLSGYFGALGAALAGIGLYGLLSYTVARRTSEIGIRMAVGATTNNVSLLVLGDALIMLGAGLFAGGIMVLWSRPLAAYVVRDLSSESALPLALAAAAIGVVGLLACLVPARRAARVDPIVALRGE